MRRTNPALRVGLLTFASLLAILVFYTGFAAANMNPDPLIDSNRPFEAMFNTFVANLPLNLLMITGFLFHTLKRSKKLELNIHPDRYFRILGVSTICLTLFGSVVDYIVFVQVDTLDGYILGLFAIGFSFYFVVRFPLRHDLVVSIAVSVAVVAMNAISWSILASLDIVGSPGYYCFCLFTMVMFAFSGELFFTYLNWYRKKYEEAHLDKKSGAAAATASED